MPHSTQFKFSTTWNHNTARWEKREHQRQMKGVQGVHLLSPPLLWTRLRAWGCHWYEVRTFPGARPGHGKAPRGAVSEKIRVQHCDWSVDSKLWWKRAERLSGNCRVKCYIRMTLWKCITFFHTSLSSLSKAPLLQCYKNTSRGDFDLCAFECDFQCPPPCLSGSVQHNSSFLAILSASLAHSLSPCMTSWWPATSARKDEARWVDLHSEVGMEQKYVVVSVISKYLNVLYEVTFGCEKCPWTTFRGKKIPASYFYNSCQSNMRSVNK